jgi:hypothetical protein
LFSRETREHLESGWKGIDAKSKAVSIRRIKGYIAAALDDIVLAANTLSAEDQNDIFTEERIRPLASALLTASMKKKITASTKEDRAAMVERELQLAAMMMEKGAAKCLGAVKYPYASKMQSEAYGLVSILKAEATGHQGMSLNVNETPIGEKREKVPPFIF